jgi:hypothetical protein
MCFAPGRQLRQCKAARRVRDGKVESGGWLGKFSIHWRRSRKPAQLEAAVTNIHGNQVGRGLSHAFYSTVSGARQHRAADQFIVRASFSGAK